MNTLFMKTIITKGIICAVLSSLCFAAEKIDDIEMNRNGSTSTQFLSRSTIIEDLDIEPNQCTITINIIEINELPDITFGHHNIPKNCIQTIKEFCLKHSGKIISTVVSGVIVYEICTFLVTL